MEDNQLEILPIGECPTYEQLRELEAAIVSTGDPSECPETHHWADGMYGREVFIPAGTVLTGKIHKQSTLNFLMQGEITVTTPDGMRRLKAPAIFTSEAGCKKAGYAHTDVIWVNVHPTKLRDLASIEAKFIEPEAPLMLNKESVCLG